jgi:hypothetical protein
MKIINMNSDWYNMDLNKQLTVGPIDFGASIGVYVNKIKKVG